MHDDVMFRFLRSSILIVLVSTLASSCVSQRTVLWHGPNATPSSIAAAKAAGGEQVKPQAIVPIFIATSRKQSGNLALPYGSERSSALSYSRVEVGIPVAHRPGLVEKAVNRPDAAKHFVATGIDQFSDGQSFVGKIDAALSRKGPKDQELVIFVHGYNNNFADGTFRAAQFAYDYKINSVMVHYAWPSAAALGMYVYDRDSANFARRGLAKLLGLAASTKAQRIYLIGHSMGGFVTMEALRTLAISGNRGVLKRIDHVVLAAPDIDIDVFENQLDEIETSPPMAVLVSTRDNALNVSSILTGGGSRLGDGSSIERMQSHGIKVMDVSEVDGGTHSAFASSPSLIALIADGGMLAESLVRKGVDPAPIGASPITRAASMLIYAPVKAVGALAGTDRR